MKKWLTALDRILRGETTNVASIKDGLAEVPLGGMIVVIVCLGAIYGMGMGTYALSRTGGPSVAQFIAATVKIPALFLLTLVITFPSLYVFNALVGSRLELLSVLRLLIAALAVTLAVLASFGPIVAFFSVSTTSYSFMVLLNVAMCAAAGALGLTFLRQTLHRLTIAGVLPPPAIPPPLPGGTLPPSALDRLEGQPLGQHVVAVFRCWMIVFALVGSQMGWVLRPFIGNPEIPFTFFRARDSNFFLAVWEHLLNVFR
jgi:hypothetical protein